MADVENEDHGIESDSEDPLESWEDASAFGVSDDKDPVCKVPVEERIADLPIS